MSLQGILLSYFPGLLLHFPRNHFLTPYISISRIISTWCFIIESFPVYDCLCLPKSTARQGKSSSGMHSFPSYSHSPCFSFNKLFLCFLLSLTLSASLFISSLFLSSSLSTLLTVFFLLLILFHPAISLSISILVSFPAPAEALCLCQILAWVACFHMEVFRR